MEVPSVEQKRQFWPWKSELISGINANICIFVLELFSHLISVSTANRWVEHGEQSIAFRIASWHDQRAAQGDLKIAVEHDSNMMAFVSNKAISNRRGFAKKLRESIDQTDFESVRFLEAIYGIVSQMHSPCLRLELLQYVLGLDNRYSVAHVARSVELAAQCLSVSAREVNPSRGGNAPPPPPTHDGAKQSP